MKTIIILLLTANICIGQSKGDNAIIIKDSSITIEQVRYAFIEKGFPIESQSKDYILTGLVSAKKVACSEKFSASKSGNNIILKG